MRREIGMSKDVAYAHNTESGCTFRVLLTNAELLTDSRFYRTSSLSVYRRMLLTSSFGVSLRGEIGFDFTVLNAL